MPGGKRFKYLLQNNVSGTEFKNFKPKVESTLNVLILHNRKGCYHLER